MQKNAHDKSILSLRRYKSRLAPVLKTIFHQCVIYTCSQSNSDGSVLSVISYTCSQSNSDGSVFKQSHQS